MAIKYVLSNSFFFIFNLDFLLFGFWSAYKINMHPVSSTLFRHTSPHKSTSHINSNEAYSPKFQSKIETSVLQFLEKINRYSIVRNPTVPKKKTVNLWKILRSRNFWSADTVKKKENAGGMFLRWIWNFAVEENDISDFSCLKCFKDTLFFRHFYRMI